VQLRAGPDVRYAAAWTGSELFVASVIDNVNVTIGRLDPTADEWGTSVVTRAPGLNVDVESIVWTGSRLAVISHTHTGALFDPETDQVTELAPSLSVLRFPAVALDDNVVSVGDRWLDARTGAWRDASEVPGRVREFPVAVRWRDAAVVWGGNACGPGASCGALVDPEVGLLWTPPALDTTPHSVRIARCQPPTGDEPMVAFYGLTEVPEGFAPAGPVERSEDGYPDAGGETHDVLRLVDPQGRSIEIDAFGAETPSEFVAAAHQGAPAELVQVRRCIDTNDGVVESPWTLEVSSTPSRLVAGTQEWEYGGFVVVGGPGVTRDEVLAVAAGLRIR
jgi:hypothetical protein